MSLRHAGEKDRSKRKHTKKSSSRKSGHRHLERSSRHNRHKSRDSNHLKGANKITKADYFLRQTEFRVWLAQTKNQYVEELSTDEAMELFQDKFAKKWNHGKLSKIFYEGLPDAMVEETKRTRHRWEFVANLGDKEKLELESAKDSVDVATKQKHLLVSRSEKKNENEVKKEEDRNSKKQWSQLDDGNEGEGNKKWAKTNRKRNREVRDIELEELGVKATGREAQIEKKRQFADRLHGAARDREAARDGLDLNEDFLMGGRTGEDGDLQRRMAHRDLARKRKLEQQQTRIASLQAKEAARMDKFLSDIGLSGSNAKDGKPMTIAPRQ